MKTRIINNGKDDILVITAEEDKVLYCIYNQEKYTHEVFCNSIGDHLLTEKDFIEINKNDEVIDNHGYNFFGMSYAEIKTFIIKLHYSYDDQIAILCNYSLDPTKYKEVYDDMQEWRLYASEIASKYSN